MKKRLPDDHLSVGYKRAKDNFKKLENPFDKIERLRKISEDKWAEYMAASSEYEKYSGVYEAELNQYMDKCRAVQAIANTFEDKMDSWNLIPPTVFDFGMDANPF
jgi:uncharacterized phage infection (PIP) family protein YhgE